MTDEAQSDCASIESKSLPLFDAETLFLLRRIQRTTERQVNVAGVQEDDILKGRSVAFWKSFDRII